ncbi:hypothetical protein ScalyP_jg2489 [Parmales sp. scaly parma]|nr:hypothetical protein ScalyP_jg2489 [Parmales sp. scaly parma]
MATPSKRFRTKLLVAELFFLGSLIFLIPFKYHVSVLVMLVVHLWLCGYFYYNTIERVAVQDDHITIEIRNADLSIPLNRVTAITPTQSTFCNNGVFGFSAVRGMLVTEAGIRINTDMCCKPFWVSDNLSEATKLWKDLVVVFSPGCGAHEFCEIHKELIAAINVAHITGNPLDTSFAIRDEMNTKNKEVGVQLVDNVDNFYDEFDPKTNDEVMEVKVEDVKLLNC